MRASEAQSAFSRNESHCYVKGSFRSHSKSLLNHQSADVQSGLCQNVQKIWTRTECHQVVKELHYNDDLQKCGHQLNNSIWKLHFGPESDDNVG